MEGPNNRCVYTKSPREDIALVKDIPMGIYTTSLMQTREHHLETLANQQTDK